MSESKFSKSDAIWHGINITKKYFLFIFGVGIIYTVFNLGTGILENLAGKSRMTKLDMKRLIPEPEGREHFFRYLVEIGYINEFGTVQPKLKNLAGPSEMILSPLAEEKDRGTIYGFLNTYRYRLPFPKEVYYFLSFILWVLSMLMAAGFLKITLKLSRDQKAEISELFSTGDVLVSYILASICYGLAVFGGMILLIVPGIMFGIMLQMYGYLVVDQKMGPINSLKWSREITRGSRWQLFLFGLMLALFNLAGLLCLIIGLFFTLPASAIAIAYIYDRLEGREANTASGTLPV